MSGIVVEVTSEVRWRRRVGFVGKDGGAEFRPFGDVFVVLVEATEAIVVDGSVEEFDGVFRGHGMKLANGS